MNLKIKRTSKLVEKPSYATEGAACMDLRAFLPISTVHLKPGETAVIPTGLMMEIPEGFEGQVRSRSGLAAKAGVHVLNSPGTIDSDYRGEVKVILHNSGTETFWVKNGDRIAQLGICAVTRVTIVTEEELTATERNEGGFGSTGVE